VSVPAAQPDLADGVPGPVAVELGYASIQFSPKFLAAGPSIFEQIDAAATVGYSWLALDRHTLLAADRNGSLTELADACHERLPCGELHALVVSDDSAALLTDAKRLARQAALLRAPLVLAVVKRAVTAAVVRALRVAVDTLADASPDTRLGIEFSPLFAVGTIREAQTLCARVNRPNVGLILDSWHFFHGDARWFDLEALACEQLLMVHFNDHGRLSSGGIGADKDRRLLPGAGSFPLRRFVDEIRGIGYSGRVEIEVVSPDLRKISVAEYARLTYQAGARFWASPATPHMPNLADEETDDGF